MKPESFVPGFLLPVVLALSAGTVSAENWPQWRGPGGHGISLETGILDQWGPDQNIRWKTEIPGRGHSSPIVWGNTVFVTSAVEGETLPQPTAPPHYMSGEEFTHPDWTGSDHIWVMKVHALDRKTGKHLWERTSYEGKVYDHRHRKNTYASATPLTDGTYLYVYFGSEGLYCYDLGGSLVWKRSLGNIGTIGMGNGTSPVLFDGKIIVVADQEFDGQGSFMVALDKDTGKQVWRVERRARATWATPMLLTTNQRNELIVPGAENNISYDPATGSELWRTAGLVSHAIPSPISDGDVVFLSAGSQDKHSMAVRLGGSGDLDGTPQILWQYPKGSAYVPSPIYYDGYFYLLSDKGIVTCLDPKTGKVVYEGGRMPSPGSVKASPVALEGKLLITNENGETFVVRAGTEFEVLRTNSVDEPVWASPAISSGVIFIRGQEHLFAIGP